MNRPGQRGYSSCCGLVSPSTPEETFGRESGTVGRPCHNQGQREYGRRLLPTGALALFVSLAAGQQPAAPPPNFALHTAAGPKATGPLLRLTADGSVTVGPGKGSVCPGAELVSLRRAGVPLPPHPTGPQVVFANGDRVLLDPQGPFRVADDLLRFRPRPPLTAGDQTFRPPLGVVTLLWLRPPRGTENPGLLLRRLQSQKRTRDRVLLDNGDFLEGVVTALDGANTCRVRETAGKVREVPSAAVAVIAFRSDRQTPGLPKTAFAQLVLADGARLSLTAATLDEAARVIRGRTLFGAEATFPLADLIALDMRQGRAVYLSDLAAVGYEHTPYLGVSWPLVRDGSVTGGPLRLRTGTHDKGLGMHARSRVSYRLDGKYRTFEALVGLDAVTGKGGRARVAVLLDGKAQCSAGRRN